MHPHADLITNFYRSFQRLDAPAMLTSYHRDIVFSDPAFPQLVGDEARAMWQMLTARAKNFGLTFSDVAANDEAGAARWVATYTFSKTGRTVENRIAARFAFRDGLIIRHTDSFNLWRWAAMALGPTGLLLGWSPPVRGKIRREAARGLADFRRAAQ